MFDSDDNYEKLKRCEVLASKKNVSVSQISLAYLMNLDILTCPIVSSTSIKRIKENASSSEIN